MKSFDPLSRSNFCIWWELSTLNTFCLVVLVQLPSCVQFFVTPMDCSMPDFPVLHHLLELAQTRVHWVSDAIQPSHPLIPFSSCLQSFPASELWIVVICEHFFFLIYPPTLSCRAPVTWLLKLHLVHFWNLSSVWPMHSIICLRYSSWARSKGYDSSIWCTIQFLPFLHRPIQQTTSPLHSELEGGADFNVKISQGYQKSFTYLWLESINSQLASNPGLSLLPRMSE